MKIIDRNGRLFGKISIIDLLVVAVVILMAAALYVKDHQVHTGSVETEQTITFQIRARGTANYIADAIRVGDSIFDSNYSSGGRVLGQITDVQVESDPGHTLTSNLGDGTTALVEVEDSVDLLITVKANGLIRDRIYSINRVYDLGINSSRSYSTDRAVFYGVVANIY